MEIKIRGLSKKSISALDDLSTKKGISREKFLRNHLENYVRTQNLTGEVEDLNETLQHALAVIENNTIAFNSLMQLVTMKGDTNDSDPKRNSF